ncbi:hypothetical protein THAOC_30337, partial [Thalassiosira oceanica]
WKRPAKFRNVLVKDEESGDWIVDERVDEPTVEPEFVAPAPRLVRDLDCLEVLLEGDVPAREFVRATTMHVGYLLGDASGQGFGSGLFDGQGVAYEAATWTSAAQANSSNWREACNLTDRVLRLARDGVLRGGEVLIFTDNTTFESLSQIDHCTPPLRLNANNKSHENPPCQVSGCSLETVMLYPGGYTTFLVEE